MVLDTDVTGGRTLLIELDDVLVGLLPDAVILVVIEAVDRIADEPAGARVLLLAGSQGDELAAVVVDVQAGRPVPVTLLDDGAVDGEFDTLVGGGAHVGHHAAHTRGARQGKAEEDVLRSDRVVLGRTAETALEEGEVHTEVPGLGVFPAEFRVR